MNSSESLKEIAPAVAAAQAEFRPIGKSGENTYDRYRYANLDDYVTGVRPVLAAHGLSVVSSVDEVLPLEDRTTKNGGTEHAVRVLLTIRLLHESGEWIESHAWGEGQDRADKAIYKATTGARKYALASVLGLATTDDPEADEGVGRSVGPKARPKHAPPTAAEGDALADLRTFRSELHKAFQSRGFEPANEKSAVAAALAGLGLPRLEALDLGQRHEMLAGIIDGKADRYKAGAEAAALPPNE